MKDSVNLLGKVVPGKAFAVPDQMGGRKDRDAAPGELIARECSLGFSGSTVLSCTSMDSAGGWSGGRGGRGGRKNIGDHHL